MSVLLFGVSHRSAPVSVLEQLSTDESDQAKIVDQVLQSSLVTEAMVLSTCNRVEVYAVVEAFHGGLSVIGAGALRAFRDVARRPDQVRLRAVRRGGRRAPVRRDQRAGFRGDRRTAGARPGAPRLRRRRGQPHRRPHPARAGPARAVGRQAGALRDRHRRRGRVGGVGRARHGRHQARTGWRAARAVVVGAGAMGALSATHLVRAGIERVHVVNRTLPRAKRLAENVRDQGVAARRLPVRPPAARAHRRRRRRQLHRRGAPGGVARRRAPRPGARPGAQAAGDLRPRDAPRRRPGGCRPARRFRHRHGPHPARAVGPRRRHRTPRRPARSSPPKLPTTWPDSGWPRSRRP